MSENILIVDDEEVVRILIQSILRNSGYAAFTAESVQEARVILSRQQIDLVITDLQMPEENGLVLIDYINAHYPEIGVVVATVLDNPVEAEKVISAGVYGYIIKPFNKNLVRITVANALRMMHLELENQASRQELQSKLRIIMNSLHVGLMLVDDQSKIVEINKQAAVWFPRVGVGYPLTMLDRHIVIQENESSCADLANRVMQSRAPEHLQTRFSTSRGELDLKVSLLPVGSEMNDSRGTVLMLENLTEQLHLERELRQAQKLEAIGQLAAGIAHEINTPVQYVGDNVRFISESCDDLFELIHAYQTIAEHHQDCSVCAEQIHNIRELRRQSDIEFLESELPQTVEQSLDGVSRISSIVKAMRDFSHPGAADKVGTDINKCLESTITVSRNEWKYDADPVTDLSADLPPVPCLPGELNQVFLNIIVNAAHAITNRVQNGAIDRGRIEIISKRQKNEVVITISDNGGGVPPGIQHRIFDPFFTTKGIGRGTGQGLAIARNIVVEKHGGQLLFETAEGVGTTFSIRLPLDG